MPPRLASFCQKMVGPAGKREGVAPLQAAMGLSERGACSIVGAEPSLVATRFNPDRKAKSKQLINAGKPVGLSGISCFRMGSRGWTIGGSSARSSL
jgi:hypothetical protein